MASRAAVGFSVHTGWAASVVVEGPAGNPRILDRRRIALAESDDMERAAVYHRASEMKGAAATKLVRAAENEAFRMAEEALRALAESRKLVAAGFLAGASKLPADLAAILRSHPLIHTAEGVLYREALAKAAESCGILVVRVSRRELLDRFASSIGTDEEGARERLNSIGKAAGPPWARDQKDAAMAALVALGRR